MRKVYDGLQQGKIDRSLFTDNCNAYFTDAGVEGLCQQPGTAGHARCVHRRTDRRCVAE